MELVILTIICALVYALFEIFAALAGGKIDSWLAAVLYNGIGTLVPLLVYLSVTAKAKTSGRGIIYAALAGVAIMLFSVLLARIFNMGGNLSFVIPVIYGIAIILSSIFGLLYLKDSINGLQILGISLVAVGVICIVFARLKVT